MRNKHVVIVGAGPGGLAAALQLRHAGLEVTILEKQSWVGGRTATFVQQGFKFDIGPTFFLYPRVLGDIFTSIGRDLFAEVPMHRLDPLYRLHFEAGGELDATSDLEKMEEQVGQLSPVDRGSLTRYINDNRRKLARFRPVLESAFNSSFDLLQLKVLAALPMLKPWRSLQTELRSYFKDPRLEIAFSFQSKYLGMSPGRCPSLFSILSFLEYEHGVFHPIGGCGRVSERMAEIAKEMGVDIRLNSEVTGFDFQGRRPVAVQLNEQRLPCDAVFINADFAQAMKCLVPDRLRRRWTDKKIATKKFSCSTFMMYLGIRGKVDHLPHHTIHIAADYDRNLRQIETEFKLPDNPSFYLQNAARTDPSLAPDGCSTLYVLVPVSNLSGGTSWDEATVRDYRERMLDHLAVVGLDNIRERIVTERIITPQMWQEDFGLYHGATFNLAHNLSQMLHRRPHNRFEDLDNVYLVGGGTHPGSGLPVIYESARISCTELLSRL